MLQEVQYLVAVPHPFPPHSALILPYHKIEILNSSRDHLLYNIFEYYISFLGLITSATD